MVQPFPLIKQHWKQQPAASADVHPWPDEMVPLLDELSLFQAHRRKLGNAPESEFYVIITTVTIRFARPMVSIPTMRVMDTNA
jgi:hypothetical protein